MPVFEVGKVFRTREPFIQVDAGLPPGKYRFRLVVEDSSGNRSRPAELTVTVVERQTTSTVFRPLDITLTRPLRTTTFIRRPSP